MYELLKSKQWDAQKSPLLYQQFIVNEALVANPRQRGLCIFHGMGVGKTRTAVYVATRMKRRTIVIGPKSIFSQFEADFEAFKYEGKVQYVALKANNMAEKLEQLDAVPGIDEEYSEGSLDNSLVIVDEAHGLFASIVNGSKNAVDFYDTVMNAKNIRLLFLTGSLIVNDPFELVPCYNMLAGHKLFPESKELFDNYFIKDGHIHNRDKLINRILGLTSYYGEVVQPDEILARFPPVTEHVTHIKMSDQQYSLYNAYRDVEREEASRPQKRRQSDRWMPKSGTSSYRVKSRMASNLIPITGASDEDLKDPAKYPKGHWFLNTILPKHAGQKGVVIDSFVNNTGLKDLGRFLILNGWEEWEPGMAASQVNRFTYIIGEVDDETRKSIRIAFNNRDNLTGGTLRLVLLGPAAVEGVSLRGARFGVYWSQFFNTTRFEQGRNRIRRIDSNDDWPEGKRGIDFYIPISDYPESVDEKVRAREPTTEVYLFHKSHANRLLHNEFFTAIIESAIDCLLYRDGLPASRAANLKCKVCSPDNYPLWSDKLEEDVERDDPCKPLKTETIDVEELQIDEDGKTYKYMHRKVGDVNEFYEFNTNVSGYIKMPRDHKHFSLLMDLVG